MKFRSGGVLAAVLAWLLVAAPAAGAGTYTVYGCTKPVVGVGAVPMTGWQLLVTPEALGGVRGVDGCSGNNPQYVLEHFGAGPWSSNSNGTLRFQAPAGTRIASVLVYRTFSANGGSDLVWEVYDDGRRIDLCYLAGGACASQPRQITYTLTGGDVFDMREVCGPAAGTPTCSGAPGSSAISRAGVTLRDDSAPVATAPPSGPLVAPGRLLAGSQPVAVALGDSGGGVRDVAVEVDGTRRTTQAVDDPNCAPDYVRPVPCPASATLTAALDTTQLSDGHHALRVLADDAAGNTLAQGPYDIQVRNAPLACGPGGTLAVRAAFRRGRHTRTVRHGGGARLRGRVVDAGAPLAGAQVRLLRRVDRRGSHTAVVGRPLVTGADGRFSYRVAPGPSRELWFGVRGDPASPVFACSPRLRLRVRASSSIHASRTRLSGSGRVTFSGSLRDGWVPPRGTTVVLQAFSRGHWQAFASPRTSRRGVWHARYRFTGRPGTYRIRARIPGDAAYPFAPGVSRTVRVRVG
jgi:hypothetical protein